MRLPQIAHSQKQFGRRLLTTESLFTNTSNSAKQFSTTKISQIPGSVHLLRAVPVPTWQKLNLQPPQASKLGRLRKFTQVAPSVKSRFADVIAATHPLLFCRQSPSNLAWSIFCSTSRLPKSTTFATSKLAIPSSFRGYASSISISPNSTSPSQTPSKSFSIPPGASSAPMLPRTGTDVGRSVMVKNGDLNGAMISLRRVLADNKVRTDVMHQKFHERRGLKRKRLRMERHRKRFMKGFKRMVGVVLEMRRQGL